MSVEIRDLKVLRRAISKAGEVYVQPRFGTAECWVKISKREAKNLVAHFTAGTTPEDAEMYTGMFGTVDGGALYLG